MNRTATRPAPRPSVRRPPCLDPVEHEAVACLIDHALHDDGYDYGDAPLVCAALFGSKARGDADADSDVDVLLIYDATRDAIAAIAPWLVDTADAIRDRFDVTLEPWAVATPDLQAGCRTPMLVDALADATALWPPDRPPPRIAFTPSDACFCANRLLEWVDEGGPFVRRALGDGRLVDAAGRARDDITRLATAAMLLTGRTRHRRTGTLIRFERRFAGRILSPSIRPAIHWALRAFPPDGGRGYETPPVSTTAIASADRGLAHASNLEALVLPWIRARIAALRQEPPAHPLAVYPGRQLSSVGSVSVGGGEPPASTSNIPIWRAMNM